MAIIAERCALLQTGFRLQENVPCALQFHGMDASIPMKDVLPSQQDRVFRVRNGRVTPCR